MLHSYRHSFASQPDELHHVTLPCQLPSPCKPAGGCSSLDQVLYSPKPLKVKISYDVDVYSLGTSYIHSPCVSTGRISSLINSAADNCLTMMLAKVAVPRRYRTMGRQTDRLQYPLLPIGLQQCGLPGVMNLHPSSYCIRGSK